MKLPPYLKTALSAPLSTTSPLPAMKVLGVGAEAALPQPPELGPAPSAAPDAGHTPSARSRLVGTGPLTLRAQVLAEFRGKEPWQKPRGRKLRYEGGRYEKSHYHRFAIRTQSKYREFERLYAEAGHLRAEEAVYERRMEAMRRRMQDEVRAESMLRKL